jgi:hypothetical protein
VTASDRYLPLRRVRGAGLFRDELRIRLRSGGLVRVRVPDELRDAVVAAIADLELPPDAPRLPITGVTHDGVQLRLDPVLTPPGPLIAVAALGTAGLSGGVAVWALAIAVSTGFAGSAAQTAGEFGLVALAAAAIAYAVARTSVVAVELAVEGRRLVVRSRSLLRTTTRSIPLADVQRVEGRPYGLALVGPDGELAVPLVQRTARTAELVTEFVEERVREAEVVRGDVPPDRARLVRGIGRDRSTSDPAGNG